jgi:hypothetical protein
MDKELLAYRQLFERWKAQYEEAKRKGEPLAGLIERGELLQAWREKLLAGYDAELEQLEQLYKEQGT